MNKLLDLRFMIGLFFSIVGLLLLVYGTIKGESLNLWCGGLFVAFGVLMLALAGRGEEK